MYKLTVVAGPNRGSTYEIHSEETSIGRLHDNGIVLTSSQVSKRHCILVASNGELVVQDQGSSNGTFVNGVLTKQKKVKSGDRISVGEFVLEVTEKKQPPKRRPAQAMVPAAGGNVLQFPTPDMNLGLPPMGAPAGEIPGVAGVPGVEVGSAISGDIASKDEAPKDLIGRARFVFETHVMPIFYSLHQKQEWRALCVMLFGVFLIGNLLISVQPLLDANHETIIKEVARRARFIAREMADRNSAYLAARAETKVDISFTEGIAGVQAAAIVDLSKRIIAPTSQQNSYLTAGIEGVKVAEMAEAYRKGEEKGSAFPVSGAIVAIEPIKVLNPAKGRNEVTAMAVVTLDAESATLGYGELGTIYSQTFILTAVMGAALLMILYRLTVRPMEILNEDMDKALKGDLPELSRSVKFEEMGPLYDLINTAIQRARKNEDKAANVEVPSADQYLGPMKTIAQAAGMAVGICTSDRRIAFLSDTFEDIAGLRNDDCVGRTFGEVARDQSLGALMDDLFSRALPGNDGPFEDYEFSGVQTKVYMAPFGVAGEMSPKAYMITIVKTGG